MGNSVTGIPELVRHALPKYWELEFPTRLAVARLATLVTWRRRWFGLVDPVANAGAVVDQVEALHHEAVAFGLMEPGLVSLALKTRMSQAAYDWHARRKLDMTAEDGMRRAAYHAAVRNVDQRLALCLGGRITYDSLYPEDTDWSAHQGRSVPLRAALALAELRIVEGFVLGREWPDAAQRILSTEDEEQDEWTAASLDDQAKALLDEVSDVRQGLTTVQLHKGLLLNTVGIAGLLLPWAFHEETFVDERGHRIHVEWREWVARHRQCISFEKYCRRCRKRVAFSLSGEEAS